MFCIKCGKNAVADNFCAEHFLESQELFTLKGFNYIYCGMCGIDESDIRDKIEQSIKTENSITSKQIHTKTVGNKVHVTISAEGKIKGLTKREEHKSLVITRQKMCDMHVKMSGGYYEAMIQIRGDNKGAILRKVQQIVPEKAITGIEQLKEGFNAKIMRKPNAASAAGALRANYDVKESFKVGGSKKGQMVYRNYYAVR